MNEENKENNDLENNLDISELFNYKEDCKILTNKFTKLEPEKSQNDEKLNKEIEVNKF